MAREREERGNRERKREEREKRGRGASSCLVHQQQHLVTVSLEGQLQPQAPLGHRTKGQTRQLGLVADLVQTVLQRGQVQGQGRVAQRAALQGGEFFGPGGVDGAVPSSFFPLFFLFFALDFFGWGDKAGRLTTAPISHAPRVYKKIHKNGKRGPILFLGQDVAKGVACTPLTSGTPLAGRRRSAASTWAP